MIPVLAVGLTTFEAGRLRRGLTATCRSRPALELDGNFEMSRDRATETSVETPRVDGPSSMMLHEILEETFHREVDG